MGCVFYQKEGRILSYAQSLKRYLILSILPGLATWTGFEYSAAPGFAGWAALAFQETATLYSLMDVVVLANDRQKRALHDYLSGTVVLKTRATIPETWPVNVEPLALLFPWQRQWPGMALVTLFVGMLLALNLGLRPIRGRRPEYIYNQILIQIGVHVDGVLLQGDRVELDVVIPSYPFMGAISRRPARVSRRLELATRRLITRSVIDPNVVHQVVYWVRASIFSKTGPVDRWSVNTQSLSAVWSDPQAMERAKNSTIDESRIPIPSAIQTQTTGT